MLEFKNNNNNECMKRDLKRYENEKKNNGFEYRSIIQHGDFVLS